MKDYAEIRKVTIPDAVMLNARLLCVELARRTQPFGNSDESGRGRVEKDIGKIIKYPVQLSQMADRINDKKIAKSIRKLIVSKRYDVLEKVFRNIGFLNTWTGFEILTGSSEIKPIHNEARIKTTGRTKSRGSKLFIASSSDLTSYISGVQKRVGMSKAGWAECATQLKKVNKGSLLTGFPTFVQNAIKSGTGDVVNNTSDLKNPKVTLINKIPWVDRICPAREQLNALQFVSTKMRTQMNHILKKREKTLIEG